MKAAEFMAQYADPKSKWPFQQIHNANRDDLADLLLRAAVVYPESKLGDALKFYSADALAKNPARLSYATIQTGGTNQLAAPGH